MLKPHPPTFQGPATVRLWHTMDAKKDGSPCVIKRRFKYWQTNLSALTAAESALEGLLDKQVTGKKLLNSEARVANRKLWLEFSTKTLQNSVRFALARISPGTEDYKTIFNRCPKCLKDTAHLTANCFVTAYLEDKRTEVRCNDCCDNYPSLKLVKGRTRRALGKSNRSLHKTLRYYEAVTESFILAKKAAAGNSFSKNAVSELLHLVSRTIKHHAYRSIRETEDAEQQAIIGLLDAARMFDPTKSNLAKFTTYASIWLRRRMQARKTSHCKPGVAIIKGAIKTTGSIETTDSEDSSDRYHPGAKTVDFVLQVDMAAALAKLDMLSREILEANALHKVSMRELSDRHSMTVGRIRQIVKNAKEEMAISLKDHA